MRTVAAASARAALDAAATFGGFFDTTASPDAPGGNTRSGVGRSDAGWLPLRRMIDDPGVITDRVSSSKSLLLNRLDLPPSAIDDRAVASIVFLGIAARLIAPPFGSLVAAGICPNLSPETVEFRPMLGGTMPLRLTPESGTSVHEQADDVSDAAGSLIQTVVQALVSPILQRFKTSYRISDQVLWGDVASGVAGAARAIGLIRPDAAERATSLATATLRQPPLAGRMEESPTVAGIDSATTLFRRRSCCLYYRVPGAGLCSDCVLAGRAQ